VTQVERSKRNGKGAGKKPRKHEQGGIKKTWQLEGANACEKKPQRIYRWETEKNP